jgi:hypothetical protein
MGAACLARGCHGHMAQEYSEKVRQAGGLGMVSLPVFTLGEAWSADASHDVSRSLASPGVCSMTCRVLVSVRAPIIGAAHAAQVPGDAL